MIVIAGTIPIKPEAWEEAKKLAGRLEEATRKEPGCLLYTFHVDRTKPSRFLFLRNGNLTPHWLSTFRPNT